MTTATRALRRLTILALFALFLSGIPCFPGFHQEPGAHADATQDHVIFSINVQDFSYPELSIATVERILDLHEANQVPVDFYLTTTMVDVYERDAPELLARLRASPMASVAYHVRPPKPYYTNYDWMGLARLSQTDRYDTVMEYETHGLDLTTGEPTSQPGGYQKLKNLLGYAPYVAAAQADASISPEVNAVFRDLGAKFFVRHGRISNLGDRVDGVYLRPEHYDLLLFQHTGEKPRAILKAAFEEARAAEGAVAPYFTGIKMHDNDFFAVDSAWVSVYVNGPRRPPFATDQKSALLTDAEREAVWTTYEKTVEHVARKRQKYTAVNAPRVLEMLGDSGNPAPAGTKLHVSGTMHIETNRTSWPDPDALIAFFARAVEAGRVSPQTTGMRWSISADIGWLTGEARAGEVIRATEALGVEWDVHAHNHADRAECYNAMVRLGGHPNHVESGLVYTEIDQLRSPVSGSGGSWQAQVLWGIVIRPGHGPGADDNSAGLWRPKSSAQWTVHDPAGSLIAVGGASRGLDGPETIAARIEEGWPQAPPVLSATVMVSPTTLTIVDTANGIDAIEEWAAIVGQKPFVKWATINETAAAWVAAGSVPSRIEDWR